MRGATEQSTSSPDALDNSTPTAVTTALSPLAPTSNISQTPSHTPSRPRTSRPGLSVPRRPSASPPQSVRQYILSGDRRSSRFAHTPSTSSSCTPTLPLLNAPAASSSTLSPPGFCGAPRPCGGHSLYTAPLPCESTPHDVAPPARLPSSSVSLAAASLCASSQPARLTGMGVGSSGCHRESTVKSSSESRPTSPVSAAAATTPRASPTDAKRTSGAPPLPANAPASDHEHSNEVPWESVKRGPLHTSSVPSSSFPPGAQAGSCPPTHHTIASALSLSSSSTMDNASPRRIALTAAVSPNVNRDELPLPLPAPTEPWSFVPPPDNQRTFLFPEDNNLEFSSQFDSGNLIQVERLGAYRYQLYTAMDCGNSSRQTNNRQWFHFSVRGGVKGCVLSFTVVGMAHSSMFTFDWMPVVAVMPARPQYTRLPGKATVVPLDLMPETPGYPLLVYKNPVPSTAEDPSGAGNANSTAINNLDAASDDDNGSGDDEGDESAVSPTTTGSPTGTLPMPSSGAKKKRKKKKKKCEAMNLSFEYRLDVENPPEDGPFPIGHPLCAAVYLASNHPYSYSTLQRHIEMWKSHAAGRLLAAASSAPASGVSPSSTSGTPPPRSRSRSRSQSRSQSRSGSPASPAVSDMTSAAATEPVVVAEGGPAAAAAGPALRSGASVYVHHEVLCRTLEGRNVDLLTITDMHGMLDARMPLLSEEDALPVSSANGVTQRPHQFTGKQFVVLTARVHPGECPGSHMMHGAIDFLMSPKDPRAIALRQRFVFFLIPMLNPDGVARGHSRVDADGMDLNRMYQNPTLERHPSPYCVRKLTFPLANAKKLALFIDMHAHANKKGTFFYGNSMAAADQVQNMLYAKLVSLNTPYLDFTGCNFSESNMYAVGRSGKGKESSSRIVLFLETGFVHSYVIETSHVCAKGFNGITPLPSIPGEDVPPPMASGSILSGGPRHTPETFADTGKACLLALLDLKGVNPVSRLPATPFQSTKGATLWLQRQLQVETAEKLFATAYRLHGRAEPKDASQTPTAAVLLSLKREEIPDKVAFRGRSLPFCTIQGVTDFVTLEECVTLLAQTPASGVPRSLFGGLGRQRTASTTASKSDVAVTIAMPKRRKASRSPSSPAGALGTTTAATEQP